MQLCCAHQWLLVSPPIPCCRSIWPTSLTYLTLLQIDLIGPLLVTHPLLQGVFYCSALNPSWVLLLYRLLTTSMDGAILLMNSLVYFCRSIWTLYYLCSPPSCCMCIWSPQCLYPLLPCMLHAVQYLTALMMQVCLTALLLYPSWSC